MNSKEMKKELKAQKTVANLQHILDDAYYYKAILKDGTVLNFKVPFVAMKGTKFGNKVEAKILVKWFITDKELYDERKQAVDAKKAKPNDN